MGYIPKYIQKRMIPKDAIKKVDDGVSLTLINVITPISSDLAPTGDILDYLQININGEGLSRDDMGAVEVALHGQNFKLADFASTGEMIAVGDKMEFIMKNALAQKMNVGDECEIEILVPEASVQLKFSRAVQ